MPQERGAKASKVLSSARGKAKAQRLAGRRSRTIGAATTTSQLLNALREAAARSGAPALKMGEVRHALGNLGRHLAAAIARASKTDETRASRSLEEWDIENLIGKSTRHVPNEETRQLLTTELRTVLYPLRKYDESTIVNLLKPFAHMESSTDVARLLYFNLLSLQAEGSLPGSLQQSEEGDEPLEFARKVLSKPDPRTNFEKADNIAVPKQSEIDDNDPIAKPGLMNVASLDPSSLHRLWAAESGLKPIFDEDIEVRSLSFDLSRVLFNPGVYQLQDPRSRVYNFDPYLEKIMPVTEFNFEALNDYVTSSEDDKLRELALQCNKRYVGSSSSMTSTLSQFHFLISAWREVSFTHLTKAFKADSSNFTKLTRAPSAVFLRWRNGVYAMDADKEYDSANILMSLGKSIEKLLTLEKDDFEKYRKSARGEINPEAEKPEQYHYGHIGNFLMRSQLDAYDPRLPGSGMFDLKTRAVAAVRMCLSDHERAQGYQIKNRFGTWESYEREYYDMVRAAFLKYSLQVRMGRMDGIFVAFHNIERIFGFQYIPLSEMDEALHGQSDPTMGDGEFGFSVKMMEDIFDRATEKFPEQSLRIYVETREPTAKMEPVTYMNVFAEPVTEEEVEKIQQASKAEIEAFEQRIFNGLDPRADSTAQDAEADVTVEEGTVETQELGLSTQGTAIGSSTSAPRINDHSVNDADVDFLDSLSNIDLGVTSEALPGKQPSTVAQSSPIIAFKVVVRNTVNGTALPRASQIKSTDNWQLEYNIEEIPAASAISKYKMCKARRSRALKIAISKDDENDYFLARLLRMSEDGREWRRQQDELDAQRQTVVLYNAGRDAVGDESSVQQRAQE